MRRELPLECRQAQCSLLTRRSRMQSQRCAFSLLSEERPVNSVGQEVNFWCEKCLGKSTAKALLLPPSGR